MCFPEYAKHRQANYSMVYGEEFPALLRARVDEASTVYHTTRTNSAIIPFLTFAEDMLKPAVFYGLGAQLGDRPWLQTK
jgi:hypothetical protein